MAPQVTLKLRDVVGQPPSRCNPVRLTLKDGQMRDLVRAAAVADIFRTSEKESSFGAEQTRTMEQPSGVVRTYNHFYTGEVPKRFRVASPDAERSGVKRCWATHRPGRSSARVFSHSSCGVEAPSTTSSPSAP